MHMAPQTPCGYWFPKITLCIMAPQNTLWGYWFLKITKCIRFLQHIMAIGFPKITPCIWLLKHLPAIGSEKSHLAIWLAPGLIPRTTPFSGLSTKITAVQNSTTSCLAPGPLGLVSPYLRHSPRTHESLS